MESMMKVAEKIIIKEKFALGMEKKKKKEWTQQIWEGASILIFLTP